MIIEEAQVANRIGIMQGELVEPADKRGRGFLSDCWREEFPVAQQFGFGLIEWRLGDEPIMMNPLMSASGRDQMRRLCRDFGIGIPSLAADFIMQAPFYKVTGRERRARLDLLGAVIEACAEIGIKLLVVPLVSDRQHLSSKEVEALRSGLDQVYSLVEARDVVLAFESDLAPPSFASLIEQYPADRFGISYNVGKRSADFDAREELAAYGHRIVNVRLKHWTSYAGGASSGPGYTHLSGSIAQLRLAGYRGNLILQPLLSSGCRAALLAQYGAMAVTWWSLGEPENLSLAHGIAMASSDGRHELAPSC